MAKVIVTYDLCSPGRNYQPLYNAIGQYRLAAKITESCWVFANVTSASAVRDHLNQFIDINDRLFVAELTGTASWTTVISPADTVKGVLNY